MKLILEMICNGCNKGRCEEHIEKSTKTDQITGLQMEVRCVCKHAIQTKSSPFFPMIKSVEENIGVES